MSKNTHRTRIARALAAHTGRPYQTCLNAVRAAADAGALPTPIDNHPMEDLCSIVAPYLDTKPGAAFTKPVTIDGPLKFALNLNATNILLGGPHNERLVITGTTGSGKTTLAHKALEDWRRTTPTGDILVLGSADEYSHLDSACCTNAVLDNVLDQHVTIAHNGTRPGRCIFLSIKFRHGTRTISVPEAIDTYHRLRSEGRHLVLVIDETHEEVFSRTAPDLNLDGVHLIVVHRSAPHTAAALTRAMPNIEWTAKAIADIGQNPSAAGILHPDTADRIATHQGWEPKDAIIETPTQTVLLHRRDPLTQTTPIENFTAAHWDRKTRQDLTRGLRRYATMLGHEVPLYPAATAVSMDCTTPRAKAFFASIQTDKDNPDTDPFAFARSELVDVYGHWAGVLLDSAINGGFLDRGLLAIVSTFEAEDNAA